MTRCIALFTTTSEADAIVGDLHEERLAIAARHGERVANGWYWRQVLRTVAQLAIAPLRESPLMFLILGIVGFGLILPLNWATFWLAGQVVVLVPVYQYVPATVFWWAASVPPYLAVGALSAGVMGRRSMTGTMAVLFAMVVWVAAIDPIALANRLPPGHMPGAVEYLSHVVPVFSVHALAMFSATAVSVSIRQRREKQQSPGMPNR